MEKRYQVFVSSTYEDLKEDRKRIIETLLNAKFFPLVWNCLQHQMRNSLYI